jgi:hypothetical protein
MPTEITIVDHRRILSPDPARAGKWDILIRYEIGPGVQDNVLIPEEQFNEAAVKAAVEKRLQERGAWVNRKMAVGP